MGAIKLAKTFYFYWVRLSLNCDTNGLIVHLAGYIYRYGEPRCNDIDRGTEEL
jgi:hypothetical protein